ncbi:uncharacterized protein ARMOST_21139 [Armillaria ostoyae]|uniref:Uncharacterized protein n=1 Tax=Armillaria ostoyae TaxID=47428 RepID=A0A284S993_ARMOS|nr:uncharacterized protein ARMOST_21139 [Armillaria ostoyae]
MKFIYDKAHMGSRSGSMTVPLRRNWNYPTSDPTFRLQIGSQAQVSDEYIHTLQEGTPGVRRDSILVGFAWGGLLISSFPSIGLQVLQRLGWLSLGLLGRGFLGRELGLGVD